MSQDQSSSEEKKEKTEAENQSVFIEEDAASSESIGAQEQKTSMGLDENLAGLLCYLGSIITGIIFLILEKKSRFVRFHALQSTFTFGAIIVLNFVLSKIPFVGWAFSLLLSPLAIVLWIVLMYKAYHGQMFKLPIVGDMAEKQLNQMKN